MTKIVHAVRHGQNLELLEPLDLPEGTQGRHHGRDSASATSPSPFGVPASVVLTDEGEPGSQEIYGDLV